MPLTNPDIQLLQEILDHLEQGDVVHIDPLVILGSPESSFDSETREASYVTDDAIVPVARTSAINLYGIVTQTCDINRAIEDEPFLHVCPLLEVTREEWESSREGRYSVRRFSYPTAIEGYQYLVLDARIIQTIEKAALLDKTVRPTKSNMTMPLKAKLGQWMGARFSRHAFPDELENQALRHLRKTVRDKLNSSSPTGGLLRSIEGIWIKHNDSPLISVLLILNAGKANIDPHLQGKTEQIKTGVDVIMKAIAKRLEESAGGYQVNVEVKTPQQFSAYDLLYDYHPLDISL